MGSLRLQKAKDGGHYYCPGGCFRKGTNGSHPSLPPPKGGQGVRSRSDPATRRQKKTRGPPLRPEMEGKRSAISEIQKQHNTGRECLEVFGIMKKGRGDVVSAIPENP